jgi:hypothetical protein
MGGDQVVPLKVSTSVNVSTVFAYSPTASQLVEDVQETPERKLWLLVGTGADCAVHETPFQVSISGSCSDTVMSPL